jgi:hypothetical protein
MSPGPDVEKGAKQVLTGASTGEVDAKQWLKVQREPEPCWWWPRAGRGGPGCRERSGSPRRSAATCKSPPPRQGPTFTVRNCLRLLTRDNRRGITVPVAWEFAVPYLIRGLDPRTEPALASPWPTRAAGGGLERDARRSLAGLGQTPPLIRRTGSDPCESCPNAR